MNPCVFPQVSIAPTPKGWLLTIQNEHFSVMQVFRTAAKAQKSVGRMMEFFDTMSAQPPRDREAA